MVEHTEEQITDEQIDELPVTHHIATFSDGHMAGRTLALESDQSTLSFQKLDKPFVEAEYQLVTITYVRVKQEKQDELLVSTFELEKPIEEVIEEFANDGD